MELAMQPTTRPQPTTEAIVSSFMQFCSDTTKPFGDRYCEISCVAHCVSYDFMHVADMADAQALGAHGLHVLRPGVDEGDVLARLRHVRAGIAADRAGAH